MEMMAKLADLKTIDNKRTFLYYIMDYMSENNKSDLFNITDHLSKLKESNFTFFYFLVSIGTINDMYKEANNKLKGVISLRELISGENIPEGDKTIEFLDSFEEDAKESMKKAEERIQKIEDTYKELTTSLVENPRDFTVEVMFEIFTKFCKAVVVR